MTVVSLHPEELLERDARGELSPVEGERLELHLKHCEVCRFERRLRADFRGGDELLAPDLDVHGLLSRALAPGAGGSDRPALARASARRRLRPVLLVAAALFVAGASTAAGWRGIPRMQGGSQDVIWRFFGGEKKASDARTSAGAPRPAPAIAASTDRTASSEATAVLAPIADSKASSLAPPRTRVAGTGGSSAPGSDAAALFAQANRVRRSGDHSEAVGLYRALLDRYPHSAEAHEAQAALGRLLFSDGNANAALRCFDEYLHASGPLEEDVRVDRAQALGRLHRFSEETEAWSSLLQAHPTSVHADRARSRLRDLGDR